MFNAIGQTCSGPLSRKTNPDPPRKAIFLLTDGDDNQSKTYPQQAIETAQREGIAIYALSTGERGGPGEHVLKEAAKLTAGAEVNLQPIENEIAPILSALDQQWVITVKPISAPDLKMHKLRIESMQPGVSFSAPAQIALQ